MWSRLNQVSFYYIVVLMLLLLALIGETTEAFLGWVGKRDYLLVQKIGGRCWTVHQARLIPLANGSVRWYVPKGEIMVAGPISFVIVKDNQWNYAAAILKTDLSNCQE